MDEVTTILSRYGARETVERLSDAVRSRGMKVFARIDHAAGAAEAGLSLRPTELLIFGNPKAGTLLMQVNPLIGLDLPLRALVWQDELGRTWIASMNIARLAERYGLGGVHTDQALASMADALSAVLRSAAGEL